MMRKLSRHIARRFFSAIPAGARHALLRNRISLPFNAPADTVVKLAETKEELEAAFRLLHDAYVKAGLMPPHPSGLRVTPYHSLPSTSTIIAQKDGRVLGTISAIRDNPMGFPLERIFETGRLRKQGARLAEISALAIDPSCGGKRHELLFLLTKFIYHYCVNYFGVDHMVIAVHPKAFDFYEAILQFDRLEPGIVENYGFVNGAPAAGGYLDLKKSVYRYAAVFGKKEPRKNFFRFFVQDEYPQLQFPDRRYFSISDPVMTPELLEYFFVRRTRVFEEMTPGERWVLRALYDRKKYAHVLPELKGAPPWASGEKRFPVNCEGRIRLEGSGTTIPMQVKDVSRHGLRAWLPPEAIRFGMVLPLEVRISGFDVARVLGSPVWTDYRGIYGFRLVSPSEPWIRFTSHLENELFGETSS
jgi:hypothetical protein